MKVLLAITFAFVATNALSATQQWTSFKMKHGKFYETNTEEHLRFGIFQSNLKKIQEHNEKYAKGESSYYLGVTKFADLTAEEFKNILVKPTEAEPEITGMPVTFSDEPAPKSIDWRKSGAVLEVKNQGQCGSCWAFAATGALEAQNFLKNGVTAPLSEQELIDCSALYDNQGCGGGYSKKAYEYIRDHGVSTEKIYPYVAENSKCHRNDSNVVVRVQDYVTLRGATVDSLKSSVATVGPVSINVYADQALQLYEGGIFDEASCTNFLTNHAVLIVGYGSENGKDYWLIKNSWSTEWGENGYYRIQTDPVICGVLTEPTYPVLQ